MAEDGSAKVMRLRQGLEGPRPQSARESRARQAEIEAAGAPTKRPGAPLARELWASTPAHANTDSAARARTQRTCRSAAGVVTPREMLQPAGRARPTAWGEAGAGAAGAACASASLATHANPGGSTVELSDAARALPLPPRPSAAAELDYPALARSPGSAARLFERCYSHAGEVMFPDAPPSAGRSPPRAPGPLADDPATATAMMRGALHAHAAFSGAAGASTALLSFMAAPDVMGDEHGRGRAMVPPDAAGVPRRASASVASLLAAPPPVLPHTPRGANAVAASYSSAGEVLFGAAHAEGGEPARSVSPTLAHLDQRYHGAAGVAATGNTAPEAEHIFARKRRVGVAGARASGGAGVPRVQPPGAVSDSPIAGASEAYAYAADAARLFPHMSSRVGAVVFGAPEPPTRSELLARAVGAAPSGTGGDGGGGGGKLGVQVPPPPSTAGGRGVTWADGTTATSAAGGAAPGELQLPRDSARDAARTPGGRTPGGGGSGLRSAHFGQASAAELRANPFAGACGVPSDPSELKLMDAKGRRGAHIGTPKSGQRTSAIIFHQDSALAASGDTQNVYSDASVAGAAGQETYQRRHPEEVWARARSPYQERPQTEWELNTGSHVKRVPQPGHDAALTDSLIFSTEYAVPPAEGQAKGRFKARAFFTDTSQRRSSATRRAAALASSSGRPGWR